MFRKLFVQANLRPDFRAIFKSTDYLFIKPLTFESLFQTPSPPSGGSHARSTPTQTFFPPSLCNLGVEIHSMKGAPAWPPTCKDLNTRHAA